MTAALIDAARGLVRWDRAPAVLGGAAADELIDATRAALTEVNARYQAFVDVLNGPGYAPLAGLPELVFNGGGTSTFPLYAGTETPEMRRTV